MSNGSPDDALHGPLLPLPHNAKYIERSMSLKFNHEDMYFQEKMFRHFKNLSHQQLMDKDLNPFHWVAEENKHHAFNKHLELFLDLYVYRLNRGWTERTP